MVEVRWLSFNHFWKNKSKQSLRDTITDGRSCKSHTNCHDTQRPDIDLRTVFFPGDDFGGHPVRCSNHGRPFGVSVRDLSAETEIGYMLKLAICETSFVPTGALTKFNIALHTQKHVVTLDVSMDYPMLMEVLQTECRFSRDSGNLAFGHQVCGNDIR